MVVLGAAQQPPSLAGKGEHVDFSLNGIIHNFVDNLPMIIGLALVLWWLFPKMLNVAMRNGSGELFAAIVNKENVAQTEHTRVMIREAISAHEKVEETNVRAALVVVRDEIEKDGRSELGKLERRLDKIDSRTAAIEMKLFKRVPRSDRED